TIIGAGPGRTIINGAGAPVFTIAGSSQVTIQGLTVQNTPNGLDAIVVDTDANVIREVEVRNAGFDGIQVSPGGDRNLIVKCNLHDNVADGIDVDGNNNYIDTCTIRNNGGNGIAFDGNGNLALENTCND
ncbi:right-handed parallel beta-helix repeat-containing protein, partial [Stenotrophomonas maltophilia]|nr:right-handed parallel beta-helix repeat-containing protein [Stenotrophomonas maltophilia]